jgi:hypothetical protein
MREEKEREKREKGGKTKKKMQRLTVEELKGDRCCIVFRTDGLCAGGVVKVENIIRMKDTDYVVVQNRFLVVFSMLRRSRSRGLSVNKSFPFVFDDVYVLHLLPGGIPIGMLEGMRDIIGAVLLDRAHMLDMIESVENTLDLEDAGGRHHSLCSRVASAPIDIPPRRRPPPPIGGLYDDLVDDLMHSPLPHPDGLPPLPDEQTVLEALGVGEGIFGFD